MSNQIYRTENPKLRLKQVITAGFCVQHDIPLRSNGLCRLCKAFPKAKESRVIRVIPERFERE